MPRLETEILGRPVSFAYAEERVGYALLALRLVMGWTFFYAGVTKLFDPDWTAAGFLTHVSPANPFTPLWTVLADQWLWLVDPLNAWGLTLVGAALLTGTLFRWAAFWGAVMMLLYWAASLPLQHALLVDDHLVYALLLYGLGAFGAGRILGVDHWLEQHSLVEERPWLRYLLG